jgi:hypothetical protein
VRRQILSMVSSREASVAALLIFSLRPPSPADRDKATPARRGRHPEFSLF